MSTHLSEDQISKCIIGQATPEEDRHGRECPDCSAELSRFQKRVSTFRVAMQDWSEREAIPRLDETPNALHRRPPLYPSLRWVVVSLAAAVLIGIPVYQHMEEPAPFITDTAASLPPETAINEDVLLMEAVNAHLSRPIPMPMERVMALLPSEAEQAPSPDRKEIR